MSFYEKQLYSVIPKKDYEDIKGLAYKIWSKSFAYITLEDLIQEGVLAYISEKKKYDSSKNDYFMGFAFKRVRGAMLDYVAKNSVNKYKTVRKKHNEDKEFAIVATPENVEDYHIKDLSVELFEELYREEVKAEFLKYMDSFTELEQYILFSYFIEGKSMVKISQEVGISRLKIKIMLVNCISFLRGKFGELILSKKEMNDFMKKLSRISNG